VNLFSPQILHRWNTKAAAPVYLDDWGRGKSMKTTITAVAAILFGISLAPAAHAQAQIGIPGVGQVTIGQPPPPPGYGQAPPPYDRQAEHCEHLRYREHELRDRVAYMPYGPERAHAEEELHYVHEAREQCWRH
jgi:hypothetical protein